MYARACIYYISAVFIHAYVCTYICTYLYTGMYGLYLYSMYMYYISELFIHAHICTTYVQYSQVVSAKIYTRMHTFCTATATVSAILGRTLFGEPVRTSNGV